jgi:hypothetical protein
MNGRCFLTDECKNVIQSEEGIQYFFPVIKIKESDQKKLAVYRDFVDYLCFLPIGLINFFLSLFHIFRPLDCAASSKVIELFKKKFGYSIYEAGTNSFWLPLILLEKESPVLSAALSRLKRKYIFMRNIATAFALLFFVNLFTYLSKTSTSSTSVKYSAIVYGVVMIALIVRFFYAFSCDHGKYLFRAFLVYHVDE